VDLPLNPQVWGVDLPLNPQVWGLFYLRLVKKGKSIFQKTAKTITNWFGEVVGYE
jgi:hypothetical protein